VDSQWAVLIEAEDRDRPPTDALFAALYSRLHRLAARQLAHRGRDLTISPTTLLHEAYLDMSRRESVFPDRSHFMAYAAKVMRTIIIDYARRRRARKYGGGFEITSMEELNGDVADEKELAHIGAAIDELAGVDRPLAEVVDLKFFCGFSFAEIASMRGISERSVQRQWRKARLYLHGAINDACGD